MAVEHAQAAPDGQIVIAQDVGPLQGKKQQHLGRPDADAAQGGKTATDFGVLQSGHARQIQFPVHHLPGDAAHVVHLARGKPQRLQGRLRLGQQGLRRDLAQQAAQASPDRALGRHADLLARDGMHQGLEKIRHDLPAHRADGLHGRCQFFVLAGQMIHSRLIVVEKIPFRHRCLPCLSGRFRPSSLPF